MKTTYHNQARWWKKAAMIERLWCRDLNAMLTSTVGHPHVVLSGRLRARCGRRPEHVCERITRQLQQIIRRLLRKLQSNRLLLEMEWLHTNRIEKKCRCTCWFSADAAPNKSTMGWLALLVGELRKGFVLLDGDCTFACDIHTLKILILRLHMYKEYQWVTRYNSKLKSLAFILS